MFVNFGPVMHKGKVYLVLSEAAPTGKQLPATTNYHEATAGEEYDCEFSSDAADKDGEPVTVYWIFRFTKGDEPEDLSDLKWDTPTRVMYN